MEFLSTMEELAIERGEKRGAKEAHIQDIIDLLQKRFNSVPETLIIALNNIEDLAQLKQLLLETISVNSVVEFEELIKDSSHQEN
ncbi:MAG: hypothetical protein F6K40_24455 [Okeania sp. SIO3I5]|uniref:hypothetical protein n=1 Tax=Okeania sp. SIO3I5 TaxID=2607805 RepID=UPI0013BC0418|nr:hypothetical protein [Okeania sp. SIO3I5]NEQ39230.1 hypothetical protein [Okeania sp. SIO3I5]